MTLQKSPTSSNARSTACTLGRLLLAVCVILLACATVWIVRLQLQLAAKKNEIATMRRETEIQALIDNLSPPSEIILSDYKTIAKVAAARQQGWEREGIKTYILYNHIIGATGGTSLSSDPSGWDRRPIADAQYEDPYEYEVQGRVWHVCSRLADQMQRNIGLGKYFNENKAVFNKRIRPLLIRLLRTREEWIVRDACKALLVAGDRSAEIRTAMNSFFTSDNRFFQLTQSDIRALAKKYDIKLTIPATQPATNAVAGH